MTGKTSTATLIADSLFRSAREKTLVIYTSMVDFTQRGTNWEFEKCFKAEIGIAWRYIFHYCKFRRIYLIIDETHLIYEKNDGDGSSNNSELVWMLAKSIMSDSSSRITCVFFAAYAPLHLYSGMASPVQFREESTIFGIDSLNFTDAESQRICSKKS